MAKEGALSLLEEAQAEAKGETIESEGQADEATVADVLFDSEESSEEESDEGSEGSDEESDGTFLGELEREEKKPIPYSRFSEVNVRMKDALAKAEAAEHLLRETEQTSDHFLKFYKSFEDPAGTMEWDYKFGQAVDKLLEAQDPEITAAVAKIKAQMEGKPMATSSEKTSAVDPARAEILEMKADSFLEKAKVRPEIKSILVDHVVNSMGSSTGRATEDDIKETILDYVKAKQWNAEFLRGESASKAKGKSAPPRTTSGRGAADTSAVEPPKSGDELKAQRSNRLQDLIAKAQAESK